MVLANLYTDLEKGCAKCWDMVSLVISWGEMLGVWHGITTVNRIGIRYHCCQYQ